MIKRGRKILKKESKKKKLYLFFLSVFIIILFVLFFMYDRSPEICGDGTPYGKCSMRQPYFCENGILVEKASVCGCSNISEISGDSCISKYMTNPKTITLNYILRGEEKSIGFTVYGGMADYLSNLPRVISSDEGEEIPSRQDFKLRNINEKNQRELLLPLVTKIQNIAENKKDQVRIAVSIVQNIPYGNSNKSLTVFNQKLGYSRYPYEMLYDEEGICEEKSELLVFLLKEINYDTAFFYFSEENHEAVGIKCPVRWSLKDTGYCFVETTGPAIIADSEVEYAQIGKISSEPEVIPISSGNSLGEKMYEYHDAKKLEKIRKAMQDGKINFLQKYNLDKLKEKYDLTNF